MPILSPEFFMVTALVILSLIAVGACCGCWVLARRQRTESRHGTALEPRGLKTRELLDAFPDPFFITNADGLVTHANAAASSLFGPLSPVGRPLVETLGDLRLAAPWQECRAADIPVSRQIILPAEAAPDRSAHPAGENLWLADAAPLPGAATGSIRLLLRDLTASHQLEQIRKDFVANASHELRTPITLIGGYLETFIEMPEMLDDRTATLRQLGIMRKHTDRISRIIEDMLLLSRIEARGIMKPETFSLGECVGDIIERLEPLIRECGAEVGFEAHDPAAVLHGDRFYWTQVFFNLIENALKQNPAPGLRVTIRTILSDGVLRLEVEDNGIGIPAADIPYIFKRFYRVEKHHSQNQIKGTGLGLSIVKRAVETHGGTIACESSPGIRTVFRIDLPAGAAAPPIRP